MEKPMVRIHNSQTNEIVDREMTDEEYSNHLAERAEIEAKIAEHAAKESAKAALLERLGITEDEAKLLIG
jgi:hypothetical protein